MNLTQITHNDLDGYGASTVALDVVAVSRIEHVTRYADVDAVVSEEVERLRGLAEPETLLVTDIAVERGFAGLIRDFGEMNAERREPHRLLVLDHHASSIQSLAQVGLDTATLDGAKAFVSRVDDPTNPSEASVLVLVDTSRSATKLCLDSAALLASRAKANARRMPNKVLTALVEAVDAVDLWQRNRPAFDAGEALNEIFWEVVLTYVPSGHESHDAFVGRILANASALIAQGRTGEEVEAAGMGVRKEAVDWLMSASGVEETDRQRAMTSRMRVSRLLARSQALFVEPFGDLRVKVCHGMDPGILQRTADFMLEEGGTDIVVNVMRGGAMSFRSLNGQALELAERFGGGGHPNASGARLGTDAVFSLSEAVKRMREALDDGATSKQQPWKP